MDRYREANRAHWDEATAIHVASELYDLESFKAGANRLHAVERDELGDVSGKTLLHLQCHFGLDTMSWARLGAIVTGIDFSEAAIEQARTIAAETGIPARFILSELYDLPAHLDETFDIVFTSYGAIYWLPDIDGWAAIVSRYLKPGGTFYIAEFHPTGFVFDNQDQAVTDWRVHWPYFKGEEPVSNVSDTDYADPTASFTNKQTYDWTHGLGEVVTALTRAGLAIEYVHEFPYSVYRQFPFLERRQDGFWHPPDGMIAMPLLFSIKANKPA
jgi:ubiquinone/menaquinone biosynthesis C-methylase UbiE